MKMKNFFAVIMCAFCFTACADIPPVRETVPEEEQTVTVPPEDGWTAEELMSVSYFDGIRLSYPLTLRDLGSAYGIAFDFEDDNGNTAYCIDSGFMVLQSYAYIKFSPDVSEPSPDARINKLIAIDENISVNGVRKRDGSDAVISALGQPDSIEERDDNFIHYIYLDRESGSELIDVRIIKDSGTVMFLDLIL